MTRLKHNKNVAAREGHHERTFRVGLELRSNLTSSIPARKRDYFVPIEEVGTRNHQYSGFIINLLILSCLFPALLSAQPSSGKPKPDNPRIRLAQSYEQSGKFEEAAGIYRELHTADPSNIVFFDGLRRMYLQLKRYDEVVQLLTNRLAESPYDVQLRSQLGSALYKAGKEQEAYEEWNEAIEVDPQNAVSYRVVAGSLMENRLLEKTVELYRRGRTSTQNPNLFTVELAQLFSSSMNFGDATREYARWLRTNPGQLSFVEGKMAGFTSKPDAREAALRVVREEIGKEETLQIHELLAWLLVEQRNYEEALIAYADVDRFANAHGSRIMSFGEKAFREGEFSVAMKAFRKAIDLPVQSALMPGAKFWHARSLKGLAAINDSAGQAEISQVIPGPNATVGYAEAIEHFREIIDEYPGTEYAARSHFEIGLVQYQRLLDFDEALQSFHLAELHFQDKNTFYHTVSLTIGKVETAMGDTSAAAKRYRDIAAAPQATPDQQDESTYRLAELHYFRSDLQGAMAMLGSLTLNLHADYANDALRLLTFLQENTPATGALEEFARADYLARQRRIAEAITAFTEITVRFPKALMNIGSLQSAIGNHPEALATYDRLLSQFSETSIVLDRARFASGEIYQFHIRDKALAIQQYERLLVDYPQSLFLEETRKRIRQLRGEVF